MLVNVDESMSNSAVLWTTEQAARRLGVKPATVYAYVSRGVLHSNRDPSGRGSLFRADEVERLAQRRAPRRAAKYPGPLIGTALTQAVNGHLRYRGRDVATLARTETFESVATLLWTGETVTPQPFSCPTSVLATARAALATLPPTTTLLNCLRLTTAVLAATHPTATDTPTTTHPGSTHPGSTHATATNTATAHPRSTNAAHATATNTATAHPGSTNAADATATNTATTHPGSTNSGEARGVAMDAKTVAAVGRTLLAALVDALPAAPPPAAPTATLTPPAPATADVARQGDVALDSRARGGGEDGGEAGGGGGLAGRLWGKLTSRAAEPELVRALDAALILLADHDLAASTFAARVAASTHAGPYAVVLAGLSAFEGPLHGASAANAYRVVQEAIDSGDAVGVFTERLRVDGRVDGFAEGPGSVYPDGDPRAVTLLSIVDACPVPGKAKEAINDLRRAASYRSTRVPTVEFALAALMHACAMRSDAGEAIFVIARVAGWLAHAIEEYEAPGLRYRYQGTFTGSVHHPAGTAA